MFCTKCGTQLPDNAVVCSRCGAYQENPNMTSQYATFQQSNGSTLKKYIPYVILGMSIIAVITAVVLLFLLYDITISYEGISRSGPIADAHRNAVPVVAGGWIFALCLIASAVIGIVSFVKGLNNTLKNTTGFFVMSLLGAIGAIIHVLFCFVAESEFSYDITIHAPWFTWLLFVLFVVAAVVEKVVLNKKK